MTAGTAIFCLAVFFIKFAEPDNERRYHSRMKTAIVILNWNGKKYLEKFIPGVLRSLGPDDRLIVADNASSDGSVELLKERFPEAGTMLFSRNWGYTGGYNRALMELQAEYFILLNSDIDVPEGWIRPLEQWMDSHPECGVCAPKLHSCSDRNMFEYAGAAGGLIDRYGYPYCRGRVMKRVEEDRGQYDTPENVFWASGACLMIRSELYRKLGGLDEKFFAHMEEIDLCWRVQLLGYKVTVVPSSTVYHVGGGSLPNNSPKKLYLNYRNNLLMLRKNLAKTLALQFYKDGKSRQESVTLGMKKARRIIFIRMLMDGAACMVYLFTLKWSYCKSVIKAHHDFRKTRDRVTKDDIAAFLKRSGKSVSVTGMSNRWIVPAALFYGKNIFRRLMSDGNCYGRLQICRNDGSRRKDDNT